MPPLSRQNLYYLIETRFVAKSSKRKAGFSIQIKNLLVANRRIINSN